MRSAICPGWGQCTAGSTIKGGVFLVASGALLFGHASPSRFTSGQRRELNRWTVLFWLYNLGDAYVDGYLHSFDAEMRDLDAIGEDLVAREHGVTPIDIGVSIPW